MNSHKRVRLFIFYLLITLLIFNPFDAFVAKQLVVSMESISTNDNGMEGEGTEHNPYIITSVSQLRSITLEGNHDKHYRLGADIYLSEFDAGDGSGWQPLGEIEVAISSFGEDPNPTSETAFSGTLDGAGHTLHNLYINNNQSLYAVGLFTSLDRATIKNIHFENVSISANSVNTAVLAGSIDESIIKNITIEGEVEGNLFVAGVAVNIIDSTVENVEVIASIKAMAGLAGGLAEYSNNSSFHDIKFRGEVYADGEGAAGGINFAELTTISNVVIDADISSEYGDVAGIAAYLFYSSIEDVHVQGKIESYSGNSAGVVAQLESSSIRHAKIFADVISLLGRAGGVAATSNIFAWNPEMDNSYITDVYINSIIQGRSATGGIAGMTYETFIENVQVSGTFKEGSYLGGVVGRADNTGIRYALSTAELVPDEHNTSYIGGILGNPTDDHVEDDISNSYWLRTKSFVELDGYSNLSLSRTDLELKQMANFPDWNFEDKWRIYESEGYPFIIQLNPIKELIVTDKEIHIYEGEEYPLEITVHYEQGQLYDVTNESSYESNNSNISINSSGVISTLEREGNSIITVSYRGVQEQIAVDVSPISVAQHLQFIDTDLRQNSFRGRISWLPAYNESIISGYEVHLLNSNLQSIIKLGEVEQGGEYFIDISAGTIFPQDATLIAVFAKKDDILFNKYSSILLSDTTWTNSFMYKHLLNNNLQKVQGPFISPGAPISLSHLMIYLDEKPDVTGDGQFQQKDVQFLLELIEPSFIEVLLY